MPTEPSDQTASILRSVPRQPLASRIRVVSGPGSPTVFKLGAGVCVVGAGSDADILVEDNTVSRRHVELSLVAEGVKLVDLQSRNGTFYLGQRVERMTLAFGSRVRVGSAELLIELDEEALARRGGDLPTSYGALTAASPAMRQLFTTLGRLEGSLVNALIQGESGVGKELVARAIHEASSLAERPFVCLNCGALPRELVTSELFGHKKGAFTGAIEARRGAFDQADGGTLFLDEIAELPLDVQPMLLRVLESGEIRAVGDDAVRNVKVRVLAASNRLLAQEVRAGRFREDLYFRVAVVTLAVPPLRERPEDIPILADHFARNDGAAALPEDVVRDFASRQWPGNARELRNAVQAFLAIGEAPESALSQDDGEIEAVLRKLIDLQKGYADQKEELGARFTRVYLEILLRKTGGNQTEAARVAGLDRGYLGRLIAKHGKAR